LFDLEPEYIKDYFQSA